MLKKSLTLLAAAAMSAAVMTAPAQARGDCDDDVFASTAVGAVLGGILGGQFGNGGDDRAAAAVGGAVLGGIIGNQVAKDRWCDDQRANRYYYDRAYYNSLEYGRAERWRNPHSGYYGSFRPTTTYYDDDAYYYYDRANIDYRPTRGFRPVCREFEQTIFVDGRRELATGTACRQRDGTWRIVGDGY